MSSLESLPKSLIRKVNDDSSVMSLKVVLIIHGNYCRLWELYYFDSLILTLKTLSLADNLFLAEFHLFFL